MVGSKLTFLFVCWSKFGFVLVSVSNVAWLLCGGSRFTECGPKWTCFWCGDRLTLVLCWWSKSALFLDVGCKSLSFSVSIEYYMVFVWLVVIDLGTAWRIYHI